MRAVGEILVMALAALRANKLRSLLTTLGIVIGITTIIAIVSIVEGLNEAFTNQLAAIGQGVLYVQKIPWGDSDWRKFRGRPDLTMKEYEAIVNEAQTIAGASPMTMDQATVKWQSHKLEYLQVIGVNEQYALVRDAFPDVGRFFNSIDVQHGRDVCLLGYEVAERLFGVRNPLGQRVRVGRRTFEVIGVLVKRGDFFDQNLDRFVLLPITTFERAVKARHHHFTIAVKVADATRMEEAKDELRTILRRVRRVPFGKDDNFSVNEVDVLKDLYQKLTGGLYAAMFAVAGISLLVGGIGIMNIMLVSVTERTREIGVRKALGARRRWILAQFLFEAMIISMAGGTIGVLGGAGVAKLVATLSPLPAAVKSWAVLLGLGFSSGVGVFFGLFPARAAAKKDPIVALRYE